VGIQIVVSDMAPGHFSPLTLQLIGPRSWTDVPAVLGYDPADPYAVQISFGEIGTSANGSLVPPDGGITWLLARELLRTGLDRPAGDGDVRIWPAHSAADVLFLHLRAPSGEALFELSRGAVAAFLRHTDGMVPPGSEGTLLGLDDELSALLADGGADPGR
jgi:hypothetical protein